MVEHQIDSENEDEPPVPDIPEHNAKFIGEGNDGEQARVYLLIPGNPVRVDNFLEGLCDKIIFYKGWGLDVLFQKV